MRLSVHPLRHPATEKAMVMVQNYLTLSIFSNAIITQPALSLVESIVIVIIAGLTIIGTRYLFLEYLYKSPESVRLRITINVITIMVAIIVLGLVAFFHLMVAKIDMIILP